DLGEAGDDQAAVPWGDIDEGARDLIGRAPECHCTAGADIPDWAQIFRSGGSNKGWGDGEAFTAGDRESELYREWPERGVPSQ
ncbi:unnamed protein product, partial [Prorocentrum cordatum]